MLFIWETQKTDKLPWAFRQIFSRPHPSFPSQNPRVCLCPCSGAFVFKGGGGGGGHSDKSAKGKRRERATNNVPFLPFVRRCVVMSRWRRRALPDEPTILYALNFDISIMIADKKGTHITNYPFVFGRAIPVWRYASFALPPPRKEGGLIIIARYLSLSYTQRGDSPIHKKVRYIRTRKIPELPAL